MIRTGVEVLCEPGRDGVSSAVGDDGVQPRSFSSLSVQCIRTGFGAHDPVLFAVMTTQIAGHSPGHSGIVVDGQDHGLAGLGVRSSHHR